MHSIFRIGLNIHQKLHSKLFIHQKLKRINCIRKYAVTSSPNSNKLSLTFDELITNRRNQAQRSIIVQVSSELSYDELYRYCSKFGPIVEAHHYKILNENLHYILIEFENHLIANEAVNSSCCNKDLSGLPVRSSFLWFKATEKKPAELVVPPAIVPPPLKNICGTESITEIDLKQLLHGAQNLDDQIKILYNSINLNDLGIRLRFLAARQIEKSIAGMFPNANAMPFGSTVNGFGKIGCDLDLILRFDDEKSATTSTNDSRLIYHTKQSLINGRSQTQRQMETIGDILQLFLPGISNVRRILQARVPIIKFHHGHLDLEVDLSMANLTGLYMSELLYLFGEIDNRVRPLIFCIKKWAQSVGLTNPTPGRWISNFALTCLIIFFLQQLKKPILPHVNYLIQSATTNDIRITEDGINCTFLRNCNHIKFQNHKNTNNLNELLLEFYEFYAQFDFHNCAISLNEGRQILKPEHTAIYVVNPLEQFLNVGKNISYEECERFRTECRNAAWLLEIETDTNHSHKNMPPTSSWGLMNILNERQKIPPTTFYRPRMFEVEELFHTTKENTEIIEVTSRSLHNQIRNFKNKTRSDLKQLKYNSNNLNMKELKFTDQHKQQKGRKR